MKKQILIAAALIFGFAACTTPEPTPEAPKLKVSPIEIELAAGDTEATIEVTSNTTWTADTKAEWFTITPAAGSGNETVTLTVEPNSGYDPRSASIIFSEASDELTPITVNISQGEAKGLLVEKTVYEIGTEGGQISVELKTNVEFSTTINDEWISEATATRGLEEKTLTFNIAANETYETRVGTITLTAGDITEKITINQDQANLIVVSTEVEPMGYEGGTFDVAVRTNIDFEVSIAEGCDWVRVAPETRAVVDTVVTFVVDANEGFEARTAEITFSSEEGNDVITIEQACNDNVEVTFENDIFFNFIVNRFDSNNDGKLTYAELQEVKEIVLWKKATSNGSYIYQTIKATSLTDLQYLPNLEYLDIQGVPAGMRKLDLSKNTKLRVLNVAGCNLTELDLSAQTELEELNISATKITTIDLSKNTKLQKLHVGGGSLSSIDVSMLPELTLLNCAYAKLTDLNVSSNTKLEALYCNGNKLYELNVSALSALKRLNCAHNEISELNVTANSNLEYLNCGRNPLASLNVTGLANLKNLSCSHNELTQLSLTGVSSLSFLHTAYSELTTIDASPCANLYMINANNSKITSVNIAQNSKLVGLRLNNNVLTELDIRNNPLHYLFADANSTLPAIKVKDDFNPSTAVEFFKDANTKWEGGTRPEFEDLSAKGTANCYIINKAGANFKFKATVKGNGYDPITGNAAETINPAKAYILWGLKRTTELGSDNTQLNTSILRQSVELIDGYVCFTTPADMQDGNFVIAVADNNDNILWSWHMWCVQGYDYEKSAINVTVYDDNYYIMDRNIGAYTNPAAISSPTTDDYHYARGLYFQWGRKDPFVCGNSHIPDPSWGYMSWIDWTLPNGTLQKSPTFSIAGDNAYKYNAYIAGHNLTDMNAILAHSVKNPMQFYKSDNNWITSDEKSNGQTNDWGKLWGNQSATGNGVKTMYDPCPVGYTVASPDRMKFITSTGVKTSVGATWQVNSTANLNNEDGTEVALNPLKNAPWGLFFYVHGTRTESGTPADKTTVFLPKQNWVQNNAGIQDANLIGLYTNAVSSADMWGGQPYKTLVTYAGLASTKESSWTSAAQAACAFPVRCVSEDK